MLNPSLTFWILNPLLSVYFHCKGVIGTTIVFKKAKEKGIKYIFCDNQHAGDKA